MAPYFQTHHVAGLLLTIVSLAWSAMELAHAGNAREGATRVGGAGRWFIAVPCLAAGVGLLYLIPHLVPAATIRPGIAAFVPGIVIMVTGLVLRGWSVKVLGDYFTGTVMVSSDQPVINSGPYRVLRHPSYAGLVLACAGLGLASANWVALAAMTLIPLAGFLLRIRTEEKALMATLGDRYRSYAAHTKRLVPLVW
jgi:protein-S-isoprenylcysteine O-methyltransferase Ste14